MLSWKKKEEKKERLTHDFPSDPLSGWTGGWRGQREAELGKKKKVKKQTEYEEKERKQSLRAFVAADLKVKTERFTICWLGTLK